MPAVTRNKNPRKSTAGFTDRGNGSVGRDCVLSGLCAMNEIDLFDTALLMVKAPLNHSLCTLAWGGFTTEAPSQRRLKAPRQSSRYWSRIESGQFLQSHIFALCPGGSVLGLAMTGSALFSVATGKTRHHREERFRLRRFPLSAGPKKTGPEGPVIDSR